VGRVKLKSKKTFESEFLELKNEQNSEHSQILKILIQTIKAKYIETA